MTRLERPDDDPELAGLYAQLRAQLSRLLSQSDANDSAIPGLGLYRLDYPNDPVSAIYEPSIVFVAQGRKRVVLGAEVIEYGVGTFVLTAIDLPTVSHVIEADPDQPCFVLLLRLDPAMLQQLAGEMNLHGLSETEENQVAMTLGTMTPELLGAFVRLVSLAERTREAVIMAPLILREITFRLLMGPSAVQLRRIAKQEPRSKNIAAVVRWLREHYAKPIRIEAMAKIAQMSVSTLHRHFSALTQMSPLQYQKHLRLHEARRLLLIEGLDASTTAFRVGYESVTQFNREYKRLFGKPPLQDVKFLRSGSRPTDSVDTSSF